MIVDLTQLTQYQRWGIQYRVMLANQRIESENAQAGAYNLTRPVNSPERPLRDLYTEQSYADELATGSFDQAWQDLYNEKKRRFEAGYNAADPTVQAQADSLLGIDPILPG